MILIKYIRWLINEAVVSKSCRANILWILWKYWQDGESGEIRSILKDAVGHVILKLSRTRHTLCSETYICAPDFLYLHHPYLTPYNNPTLRHYHPTNRDLPFDQPTVWARTVGPIPPILKGLSGNVVQWNIYYHYNCLLLPLPTTTTTTNYHHY